LEKEDNLLRLNPSLRFKLTRFHLDRAISHRRFSIVEGALLLMSAYIASNILGVVRQTILNALFGTGPQANAFYAAVQLPNTLFNLIAGGALTYAFIPVFISYEQENGQRDAWRLASLVFNMLFVVLTALVLLGEWLAPAFVTHILVPGYSPSEQALITTLTRIMLVQPLILGLGTVATAILSSKRQFLLPALSIALYNFGLIGGLLFSLAIPGVGIYGPTYGVLAAAVCQVMVQVPGLRKEGLRYSFLWDLKNQGLHEVVRLFVPNALGVGIASVAAIVSTAYASYLPDQASLGALHNAQMLFALPVALFAQAVGQAAIPRMSQLAASARYVHLRLLLLRVIGVSALLSIPCTIALYLLGKPAIYLVFQHGAFTSHSTDLTTLALLGYAVGLPGSIAGELLVRAFYSLKDAYTPLLIDMLVLAARVGLILLFLDIMAGPSAILAIPLATSVIATAQALLLSVLLILKLRRRIEMDTGLARLKRMRTRKLKEQMEWLLNEQISLEAGREVYYHHGSQKQSSTIPKNKLPRKMSGICPLLK
jgi:putative peptidoglycan lipid II flippase